MVETLDKNVGMTSYFPWAVTAPRGDWVLCDDGRYELGTYPATDAVYLSHEYEYRVDRPVDLDGEDNYEIVASPNVSGYEAWRVFQKTDTTAGGAWRSNDQPTESQPVFLGLITKEQRHVISKVEILRPSEAYFGLKSFNLQYQNEENLWVDLLDERIENSGNGSITVRIPEEKQKALSSIRLAIYDVYPYTYYGGGTEYKACVARLRIYARGVHAPVLTRDLGGPRIIPGITQWALRTGKKAED